MFKNVGLLLSALIAALVCALTGSFASLNWLWLLPVSFLASLIVLAGLFFLVLWLCCAFVDIEKPQERDSKFHRFMVVHTAQLVLSVLRMRVHTKGLEQIPQDGRFLLVCNHINDLDPVTLLALFPKSQLAFISKRENGGPAHDHKLCQDYPGEQGLYRCFSRGIYQYGRAFASFPQRCVQDRAKGKCAHRGLHPAKYQ